MPWFSYFWIFCSLQFLFIHDTIIPVHRVCPGKLDFFLLLMLSLNLRSLSSVLGPSENSIRMWLILSCNFIYGNVKSSLLNTSYQQLGTVFILAWTTTATTPTGKQITSLSLYFKKLWGLPMSVYSWWGTQGALACICHRTCFPRKNDALKHSKQTFFGVEGNTPQLWHS